ncbi:MAG: FKBP-type peptidyl-prolyl cis-trans isomerase FkpA [Polaribacter sp.]|jgi:FKBP-type peptidyl-prolyl cis-trans isomerase FkpA
MKNNIVFILGVLFLFSCAEKQARRPVTQKTATVLSETIQLKKELIASENKFIEDYIAKDTINTYFTSSFGFWYSYNSKKENEINSPKTGDEVTLEYNITDINNVVIYSKEELGIKKYTIDKEDFILGLQEGLKLMKVGETITFVIPSYRAFGLIGDENKIGTNQTIKSTVTLLNIKH